MTDANPFVKVWSERDYRRLSVLMLVAGVSVSSAIPLVTLFLTEDMLAVDDKVITRYVPRGTHRGEYMGAAPTGKEVAFTGINISRLEGGKIVESWGNSDQLGWLRQIGVVPDEISF
jgi:predicted ester cyclase